MYAIIKASGRQFRVAPGETLVLEKLEGNPGDTIQLKEVLMVGTDKGAEIGTPTVSGAMVAAVIEDQYRGTKIIVYKKKRRNKYRRTRGHRSWLTRLFISEIVWSGGTMKAETSAHVMDPNRVKGPRPAKVDADAEGVELKAAKSAKSTKSKSASAKKSGAKKTTKKAKAKK